MSELVKKEDAFQKEDALKKEYHAASERTRTGVTYTPYVDILETPEELVLYADLPGVRREDLEIRFENGELAIDGRVERRQDQVDFVYGEYGVGDFFRAFNIGESIDTNRISAELKNGVLAIHLPKSEAVKPRRIEVKPG